MHKYLQVVVFALISCFSVSALAQPWTISGQVTDSVTTNPIEGVQVDFQNASSEYQGSAVTDVNGDYSFEVSGDGDYYAFTPFDELPIPYLPQVWPDEYCNYQVCGIVATGDPITVTGADVGSINFALDTGFTISGTVRDGATTNPIEGPDVCIHTTSGPFIGVCGTADVSGNYTTTALPVAADYVAYVIPDDEGYRRQVYDSKDCPLSNCDFNAGTPIELGNPGNASSIDFDVAPAASISGNIVDASDGTTPVHPVYISLIDPVTGDDVGGATTLSDGSYEIVGVIPGEYKFLFNAIDAANHYIDELYDEITPCDNGGCDRANLGNTINIVAGANTLNEDLQAGAILTGTIVDAADGTTPVHPVVISFIDPISGADLGGTTNNPDGTYTTGAMVPGEYKFFFNAVDAANHYTDELYDEVTPCDNGGCDRANLGDTLVLPAGETTLDEDLSQKASISGNITANDTGLALENITLWLFDLDCNYIDYGVTDVNGDYEVPVNTPGDFYLWAIGTDTWDINLQTGYINQQYPGINTHTSCYPPWIDVTLGDVIVVGAGENVTGKNFVLDPGGAITGTISDINGVLANETAAARLYSATDGTPQVNAINKEPDGSYYLGGLMPGTYQVVLSAFGSDLIDERYADEHCPRNSCDPVLGEVIEIVTGYEVVTGVDALLESGALIRGHLSDAETGQPVPNFCAWIYNDAGTYATSACSDENGDFQSGAGLPDGNYRLANQLKSPDYHPISGSYIPQVWTNDGSFLPCGAECDFTLGDTFTVNGTNPVENIDLAMQKAIVTLSGTVIDHNGLPMPNVAVDVLDSEGSLVDSAAFTDSEGFWSKPVVSYSTYYAKTIGEWAPIHQAEIWDDTPCDECDAVAVGTPIPVTDTDVGGIDFQLSLLDPVTISGTITSDIGAVPLEGIRMTVSRKSDGARLLNTYTDASGHYQFVLNEARDDLVVWTRTVSPQPYFAEVYDDIRCTDGFCDLDEVLSGTSIDVTTGSKIINLSLARSASISGTISRSDPAGLLGSFEGRARLYRQSDHSRVAIAFTDANGFYRLSGFEPGDYYLLLSGNNNNLIDELYDGASGIYCPLLTCDTTSGQLFSFSGTEVEENIDGILDAGTQFSGHVSENAVPLDNIFINFYTESGVVVGSGRTANDGSGNYVTAFGLPAGNYRAANRWIIDGVQQPGNDGYFPTAYPDTPCGTPCDVTAGNIIVADGTATIVPNIDFDFEDSSASIAGRITGIDTAGAGVPDIDLWLFDLDCNFINFAGTDSNGEYRILVSEPGNYYLFAIANDSWDINKYTPYMNQQYPDVNVMSSCYTPWNDVTLGQVIVVGDSQQVTGIDFELELGGTISGTISDINGVLANDTAVARLYRTSDGSPINNAINKEPNGSYRMGGVLPGTYQVVLSSFGLGLIDERFEDEHCPRNSCDPALGDVIEIVTGTEVFTGIDAILESGASIRGHLSDSQSGLPIADYCVYIYTGAGVYATVACSDANGDYISNGGLPDGNYRLSNQYASPDYEPVESGYIPQVWTNDGSFLPCGAECDFTLGDTFTVNGTNPVENIDMAMQKAIVTLSGTVIDHNGVPMPNVAVDVLDSEGSLVDSAAFTDSEGFWSKPVVSYSTYYAKTIGEWAPIHQAEIWDDTPCDECDAVAVGTPIPVTDTDVGGIDFQLSLLEAGSNLGFETGDLTGWALVGDGDKSVGAPGVGAQEGSYAARLTVPATADVGNILQVFEASPGDEFYLSGYMLTESPQGAAFGILKIEFTDDSGNTLIAAYASKGFNDPNFPGINSEPVLDGNTPNNQWLFSEAQGVAPPGTTQVFTQLIYVNITDQEQSMWFDNIQIALVPSDTNTEVISGTVTADDGGAPLSGINVCVANKNDDQVDACAITDSLGKYLIGNLAPANDYVVFTRDVGGQAFFREMYSDQPCCDVANGTSVDLTGGSAVIDFGLASSGLISGYVTDSGTGLGIADLWMWLLDESCNVVDGINGTTDGGDSPGYYSISSVPDGIYYVLAVGEYWGYINELYPDIKRINPCAGEYPVGQAIVIDNNAQVDNVDFALDPGGSINGVISDSSGMIPSNQAYMRLYDADGVLLGSYGDWLPNWTPDISYVASGLLPGEYQVVFTSVGLGLIDERFDDEPCPRNSCDPLLGDMVFVGPGEQVTGINGELSPGAVILGRITDGGTGNGVPEYFAAIYSASGRYAGFALTDSDGYFETSVGFPDGDYYLSNQFPSYLTNDLRGYLPQAWTSDGSFGDCGEPCNALLGDAFTVSGLAPVENINLAMEKGSTISGAVTTGGATPLPGITVQLRRSTDGGVIRTVLTDGSGAYEFDGLSSGTYFIRTLNTQGYADWLYDGISCNPSCDPLAGTPVVVGASSNVTGISFNLPVTPAIAGLVRDESSAPVGGVKVQAFDVLGTLIASTTSNAAGEYLIKNLYAGNFYVKTANTAGYVDDLWTGLPCLPGCNPTLGTQVPVPSSGTVSNINLNLSTSSKLQGTVSNSGGPLAGVTVQVYSAVGALVGSSVSGANGSYSVSGLSAGNYHAVTRNTFGYINKGAGGAVCQPTTCAPTSTAVVAVGVTPEVRNFVLDLGGTVSGTVTNTAAAPLQSVTVRAYNASGVQVGSATSGPAGNYSIVGLAGPVVYLRTTNTLGYQNERFNGLDCGSTCNVVTGTSVAVGTGVNASGKNFALALGGSIAGVVRNTSAVPLANVQVQALDALSGVLVGYALTGPSGAFTVTGLADGNYRLKAISTSGYIDRMRGGDHCSPEPCALASGAVTNIVSSNVTGADITLSLGGSISGFVTTPQDPNPPIPLPLGTAWIYSETGQLVKQGGIFSGSFFVNGLANGTYHMVVTNGSGLVDQLWEGQPCLLGSCDVTLGAEIVVSTAETTTVADSTSGNGAGTVASSQLNFSLDKGYRISGTLKHGATPIASTKVYFFDAEGKPAGEATTNGLGEFTLDSGLPNGSYFAATSRAARPEDTPEEAADAEDGAVPGLTDEIWSGFSCSGVCAPSVGSNIGTPIVIDGADETSIDIVLSAAPGISLEKHTNGVDADTPNGGDAPEIAIGDPVNWTYELTNTGGYDLVNIVLVDNPAVDINCPESSLAIGLSMTCTASGLAQDLSSSGIIGNCSGTPDSRLFQNEATVTAEASGAVPVTDADMSHYCNPLVPKTDLIFSDGFE